MNRWGTDAGAACREAQDDLPETPLDAERLRLHRLHCDDCRRHAETVGEIRDAIAEVDRGLDEVARARIEARLASELDRVASERSARRDRRVRATWYLPAAGAASLVAALGVALVLGVVPRSERTLPEPAPGIVVHSVTGAEASGLSLEAPLSQAAAPQGARLAAEIFGDARVELEGPGLLAQLAAPEGEVALSLDRGLLLVDVEHRPNRTWRVRCRGLAITVVGTRFAVDARAPERVAVEVLRGIVAVAGGDRLEVRVTAGQGWDAAAGLRSIDPALEARLARLGAADAPAFLPEKRETTEPETSTRTNDASPPIPRPPSSAESWYQRAERAMARGDRAEATRLLEALVRRFPADLRASSALLELARIAEESGEPQRARGYLEDLLARDPDAAIAEPAQHRLCRSNLAAHSTEQALQCFISFRRRFPSSPRDREVLRAVIGLSEASAGCAGARPWLEEWARSYPSDVLTGEMQERLARCRE